MQTFYMFFSAIYCNLIFNIIITQIVNLRLWFPWPRTTLPLETKCKTLKIWGAVKVTIQHREFLLISHLIRISWRLWGNGQEVVMYLDPWEISFTLYFLLLRTSSNDLPFLYPRWKLYFHHQLWS